MPVYGSGYADWTFPELQVFAPNGLRTAIITFYQPGHSGNNKIAVAGGNPYGIAVDAVANDYVVFKSSSGDLIPQETWQEFFRGYLSFRSYDPKDNAAEDVSWYIAEEDESDKFKVVLFDGSTAGWSANTDKVDPPAAIRVWRTVQLERLQQYRAACRRERRRPADRHDHQQLGQQGLFRRGRLQLL